MPTLIYDFETLPNYTVVGFKDIDTGVVTQFRRNEPMSAAKLSAFVHRPDVTLVGFNNKAFDDVILAAYCAGRTESDMKRIANDLIANRLPWWQALRKYSLPTLKVDTIDLIEVAPSFVGLKAYGARMNMPLLQDMPIAHDEVITDDQRGEVDSYNINDLDTTHELLNQLESQLLLRVQMSRQYGADMRSKSDSQMAEQAYITTLNIPRQDNEIPLSVRYTPPTFLKFMNPMLQSILNAAGDYVFKINPATGHPYNPDFLGGDTIEFGTGTYQLGVGGIHSTHDKSICHTADGDSVVCDIDAASFYPSIILGCGFGPARLGNRFVEEYRKIYTRRLAAKASGDKTTDSTLKISLNGTFGKLASKYSVLYAPDLMLAVTLTGQFTLLMLIEWLEHAGAVILSANTDGIAVKYNRADQPLIEKVVTRFSEVSKFNFEYTPYRTLAMKDVNNYFAVKTDRKLKTKGIYAPASLSKNLTAQVCADAVGQWLAYGTPFVETIKTARFEGFLSARNVTGGGEQSGEYLGKVVRWYMSNETGLPPLKYVKNGNKVPKTDGAKACMKIDGTGVHPPDLDYPWYYREACLIAKACGCFEYLTEAEQEMITPVKKERKRKNVK